MRADLRPLSLGEILDRTFQIYRSKFLLFAGIAAIPALAMIALEAANRVWWGLTPEPFYGNVSLTLMQWTLYSTALYQVALLLHLLVWPAFADQASRLYFGEHPKLTAVAFLGNARWRSWLWMAIASWGVILILPELLISVLFTAFYYILSEVIKVSESAQEWLMPKVLYVVFGVGFLVFFWLSSSLFLAIPVKSLEGLTVGKALRRSWTLSRGSRWRIILVRIALVVTAWMANLSLLAILMLLLRWIVRSYGVWLHFYRNVDTGIGFLAAYIVSTLVSPIFPIALTLFYYDQRIRHEGYDVERMMDAAGLNAPVTPHPGDGPIASAAAGEGQA